jgi:hypothetical protein
MCAELVPTSVLALDVPEPVGGWPGVVEDDLGRPAISRDAARDLLSERREQEEAAARAQAAVEQRLVAADAARRAALPKGIPVSSEVPGMSAAMLMMAADPIPGQRRQGVLADMLDNPNGGLIFHPIQPEQAADQ